MRITNLCVHLVSNNALIERIYFRYFNKLYKVNEIIKKSSILENGLILIELKNGMKFFSRPNEQKMEDPCYKHGIKRKMNKMIETEHYNFIYSLLNQIFVHNIHFKKFELNKGDTVIDAGANIGGFTIRAAEMIGPTGLVMAIEPDKQNREILRMNISINELENVIIVSNGLWSTKAIKRFYINRLPGSHSIINEQQENTIKTIDIGVDTLDNIVKEHGVNKVDFIKMDIEGAEIEALKGAKDVLSQKNLKLVIEASHIVNGQPSYKTIIPMLKRDLKFKIVSFDKSYRGCIYAKRYDPK